MIKRSTKKVLDGKLSELTMNLENNYKDLAHDALKDLQGTLEQMKGSGELKEKDYLRYKQKADDYAQRMVGYHH